MELEGGPGMGGAWQGGGKEGELGRGLWREYRGREEGRVTFLRLASFSRLFPPTAETWGHGSTLVLADIPCLFANITLTICTMAKYHFNHLHYGQI